jgi:hypothetical protein
MDLAIRLLGLVLSIAVVGGTVFALAPDWPIWAIGLAALAGGGLAHLVFGIFARGG